MSETDATIADTLSSKQDDSENEELRFDQWVDYLPHNDDDDDDDRNAKERTELTKRVSLDVTETFLTESQEDSNLMDTDDWPDSRSLEDYAMVPNALLVEHDPVLQHELLLSDPSIHQMVTEQFTSSLQEVLEHRRQVLMATMQASQRTRRCLESHIRQRASLASVLSDIEGSSKSLREHLLHHHSISPIQEVDMDVDDETNELLASALNLAEEEEEIPSPSP